MNKKDELVLGTLAGVDIILSPEQYKEYKGTLQEQIKDLQKQLQQKENIIKEVREYIENNTYKIEWGDLEQDNEDINISDDLTDKEFIENLLEILDKVD